MNRRLLTLTVVAALLLAGGKGWSSVFAIPVWIVTSTILIASSRILFKLRHKVLVSGWDKNIFLIQAVSYVGMFFFLVGFDDTDRALAFSFLMTSNSTQQYISNSLSFVCFALFALTSAVAVYRIIVLRKLSQNINGASRY